MGPQKQNKQWQQVSYGTFTLIYCQFECSDSAFRNVCLWTNRHACKVNRSIMGWVLMIMLVAYRLWRVQCAEHRRAAHAPRPSMLNRRTGQPSLFMAPWLPSPQMGCVTCSQSHRPHGFVHLRLITHTHYKPYVCLTYNTSILILKTVTCNILTITFSQWVKPLF